MSSGGIDTLRSDTDEDAVETVVVGAVSTLVFLVGFGLLALGVPWFWIAFPVGFGGLLPAALGLTTLYRERRATADQSTAAEDALDALRERYARGEIDDAEFEHRLDALLETESVDDAAAYAAREGVEPTRSESATENR